MKMATFSKKIFITSNVDLLNYAKTRKDCLHLLNGGNNIISMEQLPHFNLKKNRNQKKSIILHIPSTGPGSVGHWCIALLQPDRNILLFVDPLNTVLRTEPKVSHYLDKFCCQNGYKWTDWNLQTQSLTSNCCGLIALYFLQFFSSHSLKELGNLRKLLKEYPVLLREAMVLRKVYVKFKM